MKVRLLEKSDFPMDFPIGIFANFHPKKSFWSRKAHLIVVYAGYYEQSWGNEEENDHEDFNRLIKVLQLINGQIADEHTVRSLCIVDVALPRERIRLEPAENESASN